MKKFLLKTWLTMICLLFGVGTMWADNYTTGTFPTTGWSASKGGSQSLSGKSWTYSTATYLGVSGNKLQVGSKNNPQTAAWTISTPVSSFGQGAKVTSVGINAYTTETSATYDIKVGDSSVKNGDLSTSATSYTASGLNATTGDIVITLKGSSTSKAMYLSSITVTYEIGATGPVDASWSCSPAEILVKTGKTATTTITTNYDGELIAETNDANVATASFENGILTVTGVNEGTTSITFMGEATSKYNAIEKNVTVTVAKPVAFDPSNFVIADFEDEIPAANEGNIIFTLGDYTFEFKKNNGQTAPAVVTNTKANNEKEIRIYAKGSITISSSSNTFDGVVFNISTQGLTRLAPITADCGVIATQENGDNTVIWSSVTPVSSVTFIVGDNANYGSDGSSKAGQLDFTSISINEATTPEPTKGSFKIGNKGFGTYFTDKNYVMPEGVEGAIVTEVAEKVSVNWLFSEGEVVAANTALLLRGEAGKTYEYEFTSEEGYDVSKDNYLIGTTVEMPAYEILLTEWPGAEETANSLYYFYKLSSSADGTEYGWYWGAENGNSFTCAPNKCVLYLTKAAATQSNLRALTLIGGDSPTSIEAIEAVNANATIFDLQGRRVRNAQNGVYVVNGKKAIR